MNKLGVTALCVASALLVSFNSSNTTAIAQQNKVYSAQVSKNHTQIESLLEQGKFNDAKNVCDELLRQNPNDPDARSFLGSIYSAQFKLDAAEREFLKILEKTPNNAAAHNGLGTVYYRRTASSNMEIRKNLNKYYNAALEEFKTAIALDPNSHRAYNNAGKIMQELGKHDEAQKYYSKALEIEPRYSDAVENLGTVLFAKNQVNAAIDKYKEAIDLNKKNSSAYYHLGEALIARGDLGDAIKYLQTSLYLFPNSAPVHDMLGKAYEIQGNEAAAVTEYKKSSLIKPEYAPPYLRLANIYQNRGDDEIAISELRNAVSINPDFLEGKLKIADISLNTGKTDQAIKYYKEIMSNKAYSEPALKGLAKAYFNKAQEVNNNATLISESEYVEAENALREAIKYDPNDIQLYLALLRVSRLTNKDNQSEYLLSKIINKPANNPIDHIIKGEAFLSYKKFNDAQIEFNTALEQVNRVEDVLYLGEIFITNRQYQAAKEAFNKVLAVSPNNLKAIRSLERIQRNEDLAIAKLNVAKGFQDEGQHLAAIEAFRDSVSLNPNLPEAQLLLAKAFEKEKYYFNAIEHYNAYINLTNIQGNEAKKYRNKITKLDKKVRSLQTQGKSVKKFTRI